MYMFAKLLLAKFFLAYFLDIIILLYGYISMTSSNNCESLPGVKSLVYIILANL